MIISVNKPEITMAERLTLTVEVVVPRGIDVEMPRFEERIIGLAVRDCREYPTEPFEGGRRWRHECRLDAFLPGQYTIPKTTATFVDRRVGEESLAEGEVTVNEFTVTVRSQVEGELDPAAFRDIKGPVPLPLDRSWVWGTSGGLAGVVVLMLVVIRVFRHRRREAPEAVISSHEWALGELQNLVNDQLVERGLVHEFYFRLSMIVRRYIERRFDLTALNWTTEEFMLETQGSPKLPVEYHGTIRSFLRTCDMVKFARHAPHAEEINEALNTARDFVDQSAENEPQWMTAA